jgi:hypothetical protein
MFETENDIWQHAIAKRKTSRVHGITPEGWPRRKYEIEQAVKAVIKEANVDG